MAAYPCRCKRRDHVGERESVYGVERQVDYFSFIGQSRVVQNSLHFWLLAACQLCSHGVATGRCCLIRLLLARPGHQAGLLTLQTKDAQRGRRLDFARPVKGARQLGQETSRRITCAAQPRLLTTTDVSSTVAELSGSHDGGGDGDSGQDPGAATHGADAVVDTRLVSEPHSDALVSVPVDAGGSKAGGSRPLRVTSDSDGRLPTHGTGPDERGTAVVDMLAAQPASGSGGAAAPAEHPPPPPPQQNGSEDEFTSGGGRDGGGGGKYRPIATLGPVLSAADESQLIAALACVDTRLPRADIVAIVHAKRRADKDLWSRTVASVFGALLGRIDVSLNRTADTDMGGAAAADEAEQLPTDESGTDDGMEPLGPDEDEGPEDRPGVVEETSASGGGGGGSADHARSRHVGKMMSDRAITVSAAHSSAPGVRRGPLADPAVRAYLRSGGKPDTILSRTGNFYERLLTALSWPFLVFGPVFLISVLPVLVAPFAPAIFVAPLMMGLLLPLLVGAVVVVFGGYDGALARIGVVVWPSMVMAVILTVSCGLLLQRPTQAASAHVVGSGWDIQEWDAANIDDDAARQMFAADPEEFSLRDAPVYEYQEEGSSVKYCYVPSGPARDNQIPSFFSCKFEGSFAEGLSCAERIAGTRPSFSAEPSDGDEWTQEVFMGSSECVEALQALIVGRWDGTLVVDRLPAEYGTAAVTGADEVANAHNFTIAVTPPLDKIEWVTEESVDTTTPIGILIPRLHFGQFETDVMQVLVVTSFGLYFITLVRWLRRTESCLCL